MKETLQLQPFDPTDPTGSLHSLWESTLETPELMPRIMSRINSARSLNLQSHIKSCTACNLRKFCKSPVPFSIPYDLNHSPCVIISESPSQEDDRHSTPFHPSNPSARLLHSTLASCSTPLNPYFLHCVSCRPPANRPPTPTEFKSCRPNLNSQISLLSPWLIISLGGQAIKQFHPMLGVTQDRGKFFRTIINSIPYWVLATWSPSYVLRAIKNHTDLRFTCPTYIQFLEDIQLASTAVYIAQNLGGHITDGIMCLVPHGDTKKQAPNSPNPSTSPNPPKSLYLDKLDNFEHDAF